jgi:hypothetical protein
MHVCLNKKVEAHIDVLPGLFCRYEIDSSVSRAGPFTGQGGLRFSAGFKKLPCCFPQIKQLSFKQFLVHLLLK